MFKKIMVGGFIIHPLCHKMGKLPVHLRLVVGMISQGFAKLTTALKPLNADIQGSGFLGFFQPDEREAPQDSCHNTIPGTI